MSAARHELARVTACWHVDRGTRDAETPCAIPSGNRFETLQVARVRNIRAAWIIEQAVLQLAGDAARRAAIAVGGDDLAIGSDNDDSADQPRGPGIAAVLEGQVACAEEEEARAGAVEDAAVGEHVGDAVAPDVAACRAMGGGDEKASGMRCVASERGRWRARGAPVMAASFMDERRLRWRRSLDTAARGMGGSVRPGPETRRGGELLGGGQVGDVVGRKGRRTEEGIHHR